MFDKRLMKICPESKKFIFGNIAFQWLELFCNCAMIISISILIQNLYKQEFNFCNSIPLLICSLISSFIGNFNLK